MKPIDCVFLSRFPRWQLRPIPLGTSGGLWETTGEEGRGTRRRKSGKGRRWEEEEEESEGGLAGHLGTSTQEPFQSKH